MSELTSLTLAQACEQLRRKEFSATELVEAHLAAMERARILNAYVLETPDRRRAKPNAADERLQAGEGRRLESTPLAIKDMFARRATRTTAGSHMLANFVPNYASTVTANLWRDGAVMLGKLNN